MAGMMRCFPIFAENMLMLRLLLLFIGICGTCLPGMAQGRIVMNEDPVIGRMMDTYIQVNKAKKTVSGWRVQILATPDRQNLDRNLQTFQYRFPNLSADWVHHNPYYKIRVGAFSNKLDAMRLLHILRQDYPGAYLVADDQMRPAELLGNY
jgi:hypothetical protein